MLKRLQDEWLTVMLAFAETKECLEEINDVGCGIEIKVKATLVSDFQVRKEAIDGQPYSAAGRNLSAADIVTISSDLWKFTA